MTILFYYLLVQLIILHIFKVDRSILQCGICAFSPVLKITEAQKNLAYAKMKLLGAYNQERGGDGCGMLLNGQVYKGWRSYQEPKKDTQLFKDFISDPEIKALKYEGGVIIIHSRKGTIGGNSKNECHPFELKNGADPRLNMTIVHNGTISNMYKLCQKYDVPFEDWKVDSHGLAMIMAKSGLEVLKDYEGYAALVWNLEGEPNSLFIYHGLYCEYTTDTIEDSLEERPMYVLETPEGMYFSSMENSLDAIAETGQKVNFVDYNCVYKVKNGKWTNFEYKVDRLHGPNTKTKHVAASYNSTQRIVGQTGFYRKGVWEWYNPHLHMEDDIDQEIEAYNCCNNRTMSRVGQQIIPFNNGVSTLDSVVPHASRIWDEALPYQAAGPDHKVYFWKGRYWNHIYNALAHGKLYLNKKGVVYTGSGQGIEETWFYKGVMIKGQISWNNLNESITLKRVDSDATINFAAEVSYYSVYPVTNYWNESLKATNYLRFGFFMDGKRMSIKKFSPKYSSRNYEINKYGYLIDITTSEKDKDLQIWEVPKAPVETKTEVSDSVYDRIFTSTVDAMTTITADQYYSLLFFSFDYMCKGKKNSLYPDAEEVEQEVRGVIDCAVAKGHSIRKEIEDANNRLEYYENKVNRVNDIAVEPWKKKSIRELLGISTPNSGTLVTKPSETTIAQKLVATENEIVEEPDINEDDPLDPPDSEVIKRDIVETRINELIVTLGEINNEVDDLSALLEDPYAQEVSDFMYRTLTTIKHKIAEIANNNLDNDNAGLINRTLNTAIV